MCTALLPLRNYGFCFGARVSVRVFSLCEGEEDKAVEGGRGLLVAFGCVYGVTTV